MTPIKIILAVLLLLVLRAFLIQKSLVLVKRIVASLMFIFLLMLVVFPDISTFLANKIGVGRGADFLFYLSNLFFLFVGIALWRRTIILSNTITRLSRAIALQKPNKPLDKNEQTEDKL